jgi:hypothetical protein
MVPGLTPCAIHRAVQKWPASVAMSVQVASSQGAMGSAVLRILPPLAVAILTMVLDRMASAVRRWMARREDTSLKDNASLTMDLNPMVSAAHPWTASMLENLSETKCSPMNAVVRCNLRMMGTELRNMRGDRKDFASHKVRVTMRTTGFSRDPRVMGHSRLLREERLAHHAGAKTSAHLGEETAGNTCIVERKAG